MLYTFSFVGQVAGHKTTTLPRDFSFSIAALVYVYVQQFILAIATCSKEHPHNMYN